MMSTKPPTILSVLSAMVSDETSLIYSLVEHQSLEIALVIAADRAQGVTCIANDPADTIQTLLRAA